MYSTVIDTLLFICC